MKLASVFMVATIPSPIEDRIDPPLDSYSLKEGVGLRELGFVTGETSKVWAASSYWAIVVGITM